MTQWRFDENEVLKDELVLTKIDVARRQLVTAVRMFFFDWDVISLHTVAAAAHGVVRDVAQHRGASKSFKDSPLITMKSRPKFLRAVNYPQNFFKHADKDVRGKMVFRYNGTPFFLLDAILLYVSLGESLTHEMHVFLMWVQLRYPDLLCFQLAEEDLKQIRDTTTNPSTFKALGRILLNDPPKSVA